MVEKFYKMTERIGEKNTTKEGYVVEIIEYNNATDMSIKFEDGQIQRNKRYSRFISGSITNPFHRSMHGIGFLGYLDTNDSFDPENREAHERWAGIMNRCYSKSVQQRQPSYIGCYVHKEWHNFQNFKKWYLDNKKNDFHIDKDILIKGNKVYGPDTCCFVPREINNIFLSNFVLRGDCPVGVYHEKSSNKFIARLNINGKKKNLGTFKTKEEAFNAYKLEKEAYIRLIANKFKREISIDCYNALMNYKIEITD